MTKSVDHDAYIAAAPEQFHAMLGELRAQLMPGLQLGETISAGYAAFSKQCGLYVDPGSIAAHADEIVSLKPKATRTA